MTGKELWKIFVSRRGFTNCQHEEWAFGVDADLLANLVLTGEKTATASAYPLYKLENEPLPTAGEYSVILDSQQQAVCVIQSTKVYVVPFHQVSAEHARKEGEGDKSLAYWRKVHENCFAQWLQEAGLAFTPDMKVVCEEFSVVFSPQEI